MGRTLAEKVWDEHVVRSTPGEPDLLYIDLHLIHEVTSPQAFDGLRLAGRTVRRPDLTHVYTAPREVLPIHAARSLAARDNQYRPDSPRGTMDHRRTV